MNTIILSNHLPVRQTGAVLVISLIFLVVITLLGLAASNMSILEERMAGSQRDRSIAMQAAEMALRRAEDHIRLGMDLNGFAVDCGSSASTNGLCEWQDASPVWNDATKWAKAVSYTAATVPTGAATVALAAGPALPAGVAAPEYLIEGKLDQSLGLAGSGRWLYRITVRAEGVNPNTVVWLQEIIYLT